VGFFKAILKLKILFINLFLTQQKMR